MSKQLLEKILEHKLDSAVSVALISGDAPHIVNTWVSYIKLLDNKLLIPVGGMHKTEEMLKINDKVAVSVCNREIQGSMYAGCGVLIKGTAKILSNGSEYDTIKKDFDWARAVLLIEMKDIIQVL